MTAPDMHAGLPTYGELDHAYELAGRAEAAAEKTLAAAAGQLHDAAVRYGVAEAAHGRAVAARREIEGRLGI